MIQYILRFRLSGFRNILYWLILGMMLIISIIWGTSLQRAAEHDDATHRRAVLLERLLDKSDVSLISTDSNGVIIDWNRGAEQLFGWTAREVVGCDMEFLLPTEKLKKLHKDAFRDPARLDYLLDGNICKVDGWAYNKAGQLVGVRISNTAFKNSFIRILSMIKPTANSPIPNKAEKPKELLAPTPPVEYIKRLDASAADLPAR